MTSDKLDERITEMEDFKASFEFADAILAEEPMPRRYCRIHRREEYRYESLIHELEGERKDNPADQSG